MRRGLLRDRDARLIVAAVGISALGDFLLWVPLTLHLQEMTDSGLAVAGVLIALWSPVVVLAPVAGLVVDRNEARRVMIIASVAQAAIAAAMALALDSVPLILILAALLGVGNAISQPTEFSLVPVIAGGGDARRLTELNGYVETARYAGMVLGPVIGGAAAAAGGIEFALLANAASFVVVAIAGLLLEARRHPSVEDGDEAQGRGSLDGAAYLFRDQVLGVVIGAAFVSLLFMTASATAEVFFLKQDLGVGDFVYGAVFAAWTAGMVAGAVFLARRIRPEHLALGAVVMIAVQGLGLGLPTVWLAVGFGAAMWFVGGIAHGTKNVLVRTLIQSRVPQRLHGRAFAAYNGIRNGAELIALAGGGALVAALGGRVTLALAGAIPVLAAAAALALYLRSEAGRAGPDADGSPTNEALESEPIPTSAALVE